MNCKVLVTGGAGYIGSHIVKRLGESDIKSVAYDNLSTGNREAVLYGEFVEGDLNDLEKLSKVIDEHKIDSVMHFAGSIVVPESVENPIKYYENNTLNSLKLIDLCIKKNITNFIFSSTASVYGMGDGGVMTEESPTSPINPYGESKLMIEKMLRDISNANPNFNYCALRYFNVAGADLDGLIGQSFPNATHLIKVALQAALNKRDKLQIYGDDYDTEDGTCIRDYIHVVDLAQAHLDALSFLKQEKRSDFFNCGYGQGFSVKEVIKVVKEVTGVDFKVELSGRRAGDPGKLISSNKKIVENLKWCPKYDDLSLIVKTAYEWEKKVDLWVREL